jgi:hypothetical protein
MERHQAMHSLVRSSVLLLGTALATASCSSNSGGSPAAGEACPQGQLLINGQCTASMGPWTEIKPGGSTLCMRGDPYSFFVHQGTVNKLLLYFAFGGFCYNAQLCAVGALNCVPKINVDPPTLSNTSGIFDLYRADNPFKDWSWVYIPECTADFEWGSNVANYPAMGSSPAITIHHNGFVNVTAVRNWIYGNFKSPDRIFVAGSSGGADAALMHYAYLRQHYSNVSDWAFLADSSFGVVTDQFLTSDIANWKAFDNRPTWIPSIANATPSQMTWNFVLSEGAKFYPAQGMGEFGTSYDILESMTYQIMGGTLSDWHDKMEANLQQASSEVSDFRYLVSAGTDHIVIDQPSFYEYQVNGTTLRDWVDDLANGRAVSSSQCTTGCSVQPTLSSADGGAGQ